MLLVGAAVAAVALLVLVPLSAASGHPRRRAASSSRRRQVVAALASLWLILAAAGRAGRRRDAGLPGHGRLRLRPGEPDPVRAARPATSSRRPWRTDPLRSVPPQELLTGLRGKDVLFVFVESYGRVAIEGSSVLAGRQRGPRLREPEQLEKAGFASRSAFLTSPTFGALSWLAHATLQSGLWVDSQQRYDLLVTELPTDAEPALRPRGLADGGRRTGQHAGLAAGRVLRVRPHLRLAERRLRGPAVRLPAPCPTSTRSTRSTASSSPRSSVGR